jgi:hypothetical protein
MLNRLKLRLVAEWRHCWRWSSVRLAVVAGAVSGWAASDPQGFTNVMAILPDWTRPLVGVVIAAAAISARITSKGSRDDG